MEKEQNQNQNLDQEKTKENEKNEVSPNETPDASKINVKDETKIDLEMTLTTPNCPVAESLPKMVKENILKIDGITNVDLKLVWDPPWNKDMMSESAKLELNL